MFTKFSQWHWFNQGNSNFYNVSGSTKVTQMFANFYQCHWFNQCTQWILPIFTSVSGLTRVTQGELVVSAINVKEFNQISKSIDGLSGCEQLQPPLPNWDF